MRLIDADALSKDDEVTEWISLNPIRTGKMLKRFSELFIKKINDATTVNAIPMSAIEDIKAEIEKIEISGYIDMNTLFLRDGQAVKECALDIIDKHIKGTDEEKTGYWLYVGNEKFDKWKCDQCSHEVDKCQTPCPNCGANMIGAKV